MSSACCGSMVEVEEDRARCAGDLGGALDAVRDRDPSRRTMSRSLLLDSSRLTVVSYIFAKGTIYLTLLISSGVADLNTKLHSPDTSSRCLQPKKH